MFPENTRILVVDDMVTMRQIVKGQLRNVGLRTFFDAENGKLALGVLEAQAAANAPIQLIVSDWNMPEMTGMELLKAVRANPKYSAIPFLLVTAEGDQSQVMEAIKAGVSSYVIKPFTPQVIQEKLVAVWKKHNPAG